MPPTVRLSNQNNYFILTDITDTPTTEIELLRHPSYDVLYQILDDQPETIRFSRISGQELPKLPRNSTFDRVDLRNGDSGDATFPTMDDLNAYLTGSSGNPSGTGPGGTIPGGNIDFDTFVISTSRLDFDIVNSEITFDQTINAIFIDAFFYDMFDVSFRIDEGQSLYVFGVGPDVVTVRSSEDNYNVFVGGGIVKVYNINFSVTGLNSQVFNMSTTIPGHYVFLEKVVFNGCTKRGTFNGYSSLTALSCQDVFGSDGFSFTGTFSTGVLVRGWENVLVDGISFQGDNTFSCQRNYYLQVSSTLNSGATLYDFDPNSFPVSQSFRITDNDAESAGVATFVAGGLLKGNPACLWTNNVGSIAENTVPGYYAVNGVVGATNMPNGGTPYPLLTNLTIDRNDYFSTDGTYLARTPGDFTIFGMINVSGQAGRSYIIYFYIEPDVGAPFEIQRAEFELGASSSVTGLPINVEYQFQPQDRILYYVEKDLNATTAITALPGMNIIVKK